MTSDIWWSVVSPCDLFCSLWMTFWQTSNGTNPTSQWWTSLIGWRDIDWQLALSMWLHHLHTQTILTLVTTIITTIALTRCPMQPRQLWYIGPVCFIVGWHKRRRERGFNFLRFIFGLLWTPAQRKRASMLYFAKCFFLLFFFNGRLILRPWWTEVRKSFTRGGPWVSLKKLLLGFFPGHP